MCMTGRPMCPAARGELWIDAGVTVACEPEPDGLLDSTYVVSNGGLGDAVPVTKWIESKVLWPLKSQIFIEKCHMQ